MKYLFFLVLFFSSLTVTAQKIKGVISDGDGNLVEYVNVGIVGENIGTIADSKGCFEILLNDSLNNRMIRFSRIGFKPYTLTVKEFKDNFSGKIKLERDLLKIKDVNVLSVGSKNATYREAVINQRGMRIPGGVITVQEFPKITMNWVSDPKIGYQYGVVVDSEKEYVPQRMEVSILDCLTDTVLFRVNIYDIDSCGAVSKLLNTDEIFFTVRKKDHKKVYAIDLASQFLSLKGRQYFALEFVAYSYLLGQDEMIIKFPLFSNPSYFRKSSQGAFEKFPDNLGIKIWALVKK